MIAMIFEYQLNEDTLDTYNPLSRKMWELVNEIDGFISIERFRSESQPDKLLGLGFFRDVEAVQEWRNHPDHRQAQALGRMQLFTHYRLRMAEVLRDYDLTRREQVPQDSLLIHDTDKGAN